MRTAKVDEILKQVEVLTLNEKMFLADRLSEQVKLETSRTTESAQSDREAKAVRNRLQTKWIREHQAEYADQYVALDGDRLLAAGTVLREVVEAARETGVPNPFIVHVPDSEKTYFAGW